MSDLSLAAPDPSIGARIAVSSAQDLLVSPPLPSLESGGGLTLTQQVGYMVAKTEGTTDATTPYDFKGELTGLSGGIGLTSPPQGRMGWFFLLAGSDLNGEIKTYTNDVNLFSLKDMSSKVFAGAGGVSYRFIGDSSSVFAMGYFLGPGFMRVKSVFKVSNSDATYSAKYGLSPNIYGIYTGLQAKLRLGPFLINPYVLYFADVTEKCKPFDDSPANTVGLCKDYPAKSQSVDLASSFSGVGLFLGYRRLRVNVYSRFNGTSDFNDLKLSNYSLSYAFEL